MNMLLVYTLKSALVLTLLYLPYTLMLRRERFFRLNRLTLLTILLLALVQPLCKVASPESLTQVPVVAKLLSSAEQMAIRAKVCMLPEARPVTV